MGPNDLEFISEYWEKLKGLIDFAFTGKFSYIIRQTPTFSLNQEDPIKTTNNQTINLNSFTIEAYESYINIMIKFLILSDGRITGVYTENFIFG